MEYVKGQWVFSHKKTLGLAAADIGGKYTHEQGQTRVWAAHSRSRDQPSLELEGFLRRWRKVVSETGIKNTDSWDPMKT